MTVSNNTARNQYVAAASQTVFSYTFEVFDKGDLTVANGLVILTEGADYTVSGVGNDNGGDITLLVGATSGDIVTIYMDMQLERLVDYQNSGDFIASDVNDDFDRIWLALQQNSAGRSLSIRASSEDSVLNSSNTILPPPITRKNTALAFDANGEIEYISTTGLILVASDLTVPEDFGAVGDGVADDSAALQSFFNNLSTTGKYGTSDGSKIYGMGSAITIGSGVNFDGRWCTIKALSGFSSDFMFSSTVAELAIINTVFDGTNVPTLGTTYNGTQTAKGCILVVDPDPAIAGTNSGTKALINNLTLRGNKFTGQPSSWIYAINVSNVNISDNVFETTADESTSNMAGILALGNKSTYLELSNWTINNNKFNNIITSGGLGNVKTISINGGTSVLITDNNFTRTLLGSNEGVAGLHSSVFAKACSELIVADNSMEHSGVGVKFEAGTHNSSINNNSLHNTAEVGILVQGSYEVLVKDNLIDNTGKYGIWTDPHSPTPVLVRDITIEGNTLTNIGNMAISTSSFQKTAILIRSVVQLENQNTIVRNNLIIGTDSGTLANQTYAAVLLLSDSDAASIVVDPLITNNKIQGKFINSPIEIAGFVARPQIRDNVFSKLNTGDPVVSDSTSILSNVIDSFFFTGNVLLPSTLCQSLVKFLNTSGSIIGVVDISRNKIHEDVTSNLVQIADSVTATLDAFIFDDNLDTVAGTSAVLLGDAVKASKISLSRNSIVGDAVDPYFFKFSGVAAAADVFETLRIVDNVTNGRFEVDIDCSGSAAGDVFIEGNTGSVDSAQGILFSNSSSITGWLGKNPIRADVNIPYSGTLPAFMSFDNDPILQNGQTGTTYTLQASDHGQLVTMNNGSANTVFCPTGLPLGFHCYVMQLFTGQTTITNGAGAVVVSNAATLGSPDIDGRYGIARVANYASDTCAISGAIV